MSVVGSLIFCTDCGNLLDSISSKKSQLKCRICSKEYNPREFEELQVITESAPTAFPSSLRAKRSAVKTSIGDDELEDGAIIRETCPQCGNDEMSFHTLQMRSADEGATVFYTCTNCSYRFSQNN